jgi:hypothetical protein
MVGLGASASTADQKKTVENIKVDCVSDQNTKKWTILGPGFGSNSSQFGPELYFGRTLADSMPDKKIAFIKDAKSGTYLGQSGGWLPPSSGGPGTLYKNMMNHIDAALKSFNNAFDTSKYTYRWAGFIWHQGEFDGWNDKSLADKYETNLTNLIKDIRTKAGDDSLPVIIPMITGTNWQYKSTIQKAEIAVAQKTVNTDTMNTEGYALADGIHYNAASMEKVGRICAQRWLAMEFTKDWWKPDTIPVPVAYHSTLSSTSAATCSPSEFTFFDLSGRMVRPISTPSADSRLKRPPTLMLIGTVSSESGERHISKAMNLQR